MATPTKAEGTDAKTKIDNKYRFLCTCFQSACDNGSKVNVDTVSLIHDIKKSAARMRLTRLRKEMSMVTEAGNPSKAVKFHEDGDGESPLDTPTKARATPTTTGKGRKRKLEEVEAPVKSDKACSLAKVKVEVDSDRIA